MVFAAVQYDIAWEDKPANHARMEAMIKEAKLPEGTFVLLPEMCDTGFSFNLDRIVDDSTIEWARGLCERLGLWVQVGFPRRGPDGRGRNCAAIISPQGHVVADYEKVFPFSYGKEIEHFSGGDQIAVAEIGVHVVCPLICYDLRFPELWRLGTLAGATAFTIGASWPAPRQSHWRSLLIARAIENQAFIIGVNRVGSDPHLPYAGGSMIISPKGEVLAEADDAPEVIRASCNVSDVAAWRREFPALKDIRQDLLGRIEVTTHETGRERELFRDSG